MFLLIFRDEKVNETPEEEEEEGGDTESWTEDMMSDPPSPFACDPYESFDYEC